MRGILSMLFSMLLIFSACEKDDEVVPVPPTSENSAESEPEISEEKDEVPPSLNLALETYQYGEFKKMPYRILVPRNYDSTKNYPLHVFLHGMGERGADNEKHLSIGSSYYQIDSIRAKYPSFVIFPQCPTTDFWSSDPMTIILKNMIDMLVRNYAIDKDRISIGGFSMGAYGTFAMVAQNPKFFESAVAISGDGDENKASQMAKTEWQIFAGKKDDVVSSIRTEIMATALKKAGASVSFTLYPEADHGNTWVKAFSEPEFFRRLFSRGNKVLSPSPSN
ncbi:MAG: prolyl oligopeptidase family serine peptidase [Cyclobacteriaceae bacterium]